MVVGTAAPVIALAAVVALNQLPIREPPGQRTSLRADAVGFFAICVFVACVFLQGVSLYHALGSLAHERDEASLNSATITSISGIALLAVGGLVADAARVIRREAKLHNPGAGLSDQNTMPDRSNSDPEEPSGTV